jgi:hypothetical protein
MLASTTQLPWPALRAFVILKNLVMVLADVSAVLPVRHRKPFGSAEQSPDSASIFLHLPLSVLRAGTYQDQVRSTSCKKCSAGMRRTLDSHYFLPSWVQSAHLLPCCVVYFQENTRTKLDGRLAKTVARVRARPYMFSRVQEAGVLSQ